MENIFKASGCEEEAQNPLMNVLSSLMFSDPSAHYAYQSAHPEMLEDVWEEAEAQNLMQNEMVMPAEDFEHEEMWEDAALQENFDPMWNQVEREMALNEEGDYKEELDNFLKQWNEAEKETYSFAKENSYLDVENAFELALEREKQGNTNDAILLLEAEVMKNPEHSEAWGLLGKLHAKNDEDTRAIAAMLRGLAIDPYNLDLLMSLGISCTNEFDEDQALSYLKTWIQHHPLYSDIPVDHTMNLKEDILEAFKVAASINSADPDVFQAIGVLSFLSGHYDLAEDGFRTALMMRQDDAALWNRLGAALAKQDKIEEAFACYHKALEMKPDFVRTWGNLGLAYANMKEYDTCARFYLCALSLNPNADHIYNYLTTAFIFMNRFDLVWRI